LIPFSLAFEGDRSLNEYRRLAVLMRKYGFYSMQIYEHLPFRPAWPIVFHCAHQIGPMRIGPVTVPVFLYRPEMLARYLGLLHELTAGRALLGISRGAYHGLMPRSADRSIAAVKEAVEIISLFLHDGKATYNGKVFSLTGELAMPWLAGRSAEIYIGTSGPKLAEVASGIRAVSGIVVDNLWNPRYVEVLKERIEAGAKRGGKSASEVSLVARPFASISGDLDEAKKLVIAALRSYLPHLVGNSPMLGAAGVSPADLKALSQLPSAIADRIVENFSATGTPDDLINQTDRMVRAGVTQVCYGHPLSTDIEEGVRLIGERVKPYFDEAYK